jgi:hypothetical protein
MVAVARRSIRYAVIDESAREIVIDKRAFLFGLLAVGLDQPSRSRGNTATWVADWLQSQIPTDVPEIVLDHSPTDADRLLGAFQTGFAVVISQSMRAALTLAVTYAGRTVGRRVADLRHVSAAVLDGVRAPWPELVDLRWRAADDDLTALRQYLFERIAAGPEAGENIEAWREILSIAPATQAQPEDETAQPKEAADDGRAETSEAKAPLVLAGFTSDQVAVTLGKRRVPGDPLRIEADVQAFARLICLEEAQPPLSIGLFGGWGSGKSTFMARLEAAIDEIVEAERERRARAGDAPAGSRFVQRVVQIRFNAWHFADANLWASLTAEFFDQLRTGGFSRQGQDIHARLVERVNAHVHSLSQTLAATRAALAEGEKHVVEAQKARNDAVAEAQRAGGEALSQTLIDAVSDAYERHKADLKAMGRLAGQDDVAKSIDDFVEVVKGVRSIRGQIVAVWKVMRSGQWRPLLLGAAVFFVAAAIVLLPLIDKVAATELMAKLGGWSVLAALASLTGAVIPAVRIVASIVADTAAFADKLEKVSEGRLKEVLAREAELTAALNEARARREAADRAARALARYIDPSGASNPPRLLRFVLEDDPDTKAMEKEIGLIGRARRLFQAVDEIVKEERKKRAAGQPSDLDVPDRIILYIDDLDRCSYAQVYAVLQAIHLLLAFELFVVVVGVDVKWIQDALAAQAGADQREVEGATPEEIDLARRERAIAYLEKIFQLPFWLRPLDARPGGDGSYGAYVRALLAANLEETRQAASSSAEAPVAGESAESGADGGRAEQPDAEPETLGSTGEAELAAATDQAESMLALDQALDTVRLTQREVDFMSSDAIGSIAAKEPRAVKRLVNIYRIIRARMDENELRALLGPDGNPPSFPFVMLLAAVETGQPVKVADAFYQGLKALPPTEFIDKSVTMNVPGDGQSVSPDHVWERLKAMRGPFRACPYLATAVAAACRERGDVGISAAELLRLAATVRRYSFNRYH